MQQLPNNCRLGNILFFPKNWKTVKANAKLTWYIKYRFYDDNLKKSKQVTLKGMNALNTLEEKQAAVKVILDDEMDLMINKGYNKITDTYSLVQEGEISEHTPFKEALQYAQSKVKVGGDS